MRDEKPYIIVTGTDYSNAGDLALERAFELATERQNAEVHIVYVLQTYGVIGLGASGPDPILIAEAAEQLRLYADQKLQEYKARASTEKHKQLFSRALSHLRLEAPAHEIAQLAADLEADLVVVGTHGRRGASRLLLGSVAEGVVRLAPCPVLVVRPKKVGTDNVPEIEPACPRCLEARRASGGQELWCEAHRERHGRRHTYHSTDRVGAETNFPLVVPER